MEGLFYYQVIRSQSHQRTVPQNGNDFAEARGGVKTEFCLIVVRLCPVFVLILSLSGQILSRCGLNREGNIVNGFELFPCKSGEKRRQFRWICVSCASCFSARDPDSRASQTGTRIRFGKGGSSSVFSAIKSDMFQ